MRVHLAAAAGGVVGDIGMGVQLRKKFLDAHYAEHEHPGLIAVITGTPVPFAEGAGDGELGDLLAIAKNSKLCLTAEDFSSTDKRSLPALIGKAVIFYDFIFLEGQRNRTLFLGHELSPELLVAGIITKDEGNRFF